MVEEKDHLSNELSINVKLEDGGIKGAVKSRAVAAIDRLLGSVIDVPIAYLEGFSQRIRTESESGAVQKVIEGKSEGTSKSVASSIERKLGENIIEAEARKQINKGSVARKAIEYLGESQLPDDYDTNEIEDDWLNFFEAYAEKASSERMRDMWARVLSGEIRKPGEFSLSTLRFLSELDTKIALLFEKYVANALPDGTLPKVSELEGEQLFDLIFLEEVGLFQDVNGGISMNVFPQMGMPALYSAGDYDTHFIGQKQIILDLVKITRTGREIMKILPPIDYVKSIENAFEDKMDAVDSMEIYRRVPSPLEGEKWELVKSVK